MADRKILFLVRHGKADDPWDYDHDFERMLTRKGKHDATALATLLHKEGLLPDVIVSSPAFRTAQTARSLATGLDLNPEEIQYEAALYPGTPDAYIGCICEVSAKALMLVGHNPVLEQLVLHFTGGKLSHFPTAACAVFEVSARTDQVESLQLLFHHPG
jgi:phosphohistidine phosphatase